MGGTPLTPFCYFLLSSTPTIDTEPYEIRRINKTSPLSNGQRGYSILYKQYIAYACSAAFFLTTLRMTNSVPMVIAMPMMRQMTALRMKPARMKFTKQIAATVSA